MGSHFSEATGFSPKLIPGLSFSKKMGKMKIHGKGGLLDFSKDKLTERNKENSFLDVDWIITELIKYGQEKLASDASLSDVPNSPQRSGSSCSSHALQRSTSLKNVTKVKKKAPIPENQIRQLCMVVRE